MQDIKILLSALLDVDSSAQEINSKQISNLQKKLSKVKLKIDIDDKILNELSNFSKSIEKMNLAFQQSNQSIKQNITITEQLDGSVKKVVQDFKANGSIIETTTTKIKEQSKAMKEQKNTVDSLIKSEENLASTTLKLKNKEVTSKTNVYKNPEKGITETVTIPTFGSDTFKTYKTDYEAAEKYSQKKMDLIHREALEMNKIFDKNKANEEKALQETQSIRLKLAKDKMNSLHKEALEMNKIFDKQKSDEEKALRETQAIRMKLSKDKMNAIHSEALEMNKYYDQQKRKETELSLYKQKMIGSDGITGELDIFSKKYKGKYDTKELDSLKKRINELNVSTPELNTKMRQLGIEFSSMRQQAGQSASVLSRTLENFTKFARFYIVGGFIVGAVNNLKNAMTTLKELDSEMVEIAKVTNFTADAMERLKNSSFDTASDFGRKAQDYLQAVTEFSRAGYEAQSTGLSKVSLLAQNVGELTSEQANKFLLATDAAYKYKGSQEELTKVLDGANQIDNEFATSISKISDGISVAGSISANAGVGINELSAAIGTMTAVTQGAGNEAGRAFRGILMNIRQVKGETEDGDIIDDEALSKSAKALDDVGIKIHEMRNGIEELRNPMDVIKELSQKWGTLSSMKQSPIIEALGGKYRGDVHKMLTTSYVQKCA